MDVKKHVLKNGLPVLFVETNTFPSFTALLLVGAGSRYESISNNGIAHFFEHMAFKGSAKYPNSQVIAATIEGLGGVFNAFTDKDHTGYWIKAPTDDYDVVIDVLGDMLLHSNLDQAEIEREKGVIIEEMNMYEDTPYRKVGDIYEELLYGGTPLGMEIIGTKETVSAFTRKTFTDYMDTYYRPSNAVLVITGGFKNSKFEDSYLKIIEDKFGGWEDKPVPAVQTVTDRLDGPGHKLKHKKTEQAHFCLGFRTFSMNDERRYPLSVMAAILGGGMSSRLFIEVRERRSLCYYISTGREFYTDVGNLVTQAGITNKPEKVKEAVEVILQQHKAMKDGAMTDQEITRAKEMMKGRLVLSLEDSFAIADFVGTRYLFRADIVQPEEMVAKIDAVTKEQMVDVARTCFTPERLNFAIVGPFHVKDLQMEYNV